MCGIVASRRNGGLHRGECGLLVKACAVSLEVWLLLVSGWWMLMKECGSSDSINHSNLLLLTCTLCWLVLSVVTNITKRTPLPPHPFVSPSALPYLLPPPLQAQSDPSRSTAVYEALKDDPELSHVFDDVKNNGPGALQK